MSLLTFNVNKVMFRYNSLITNCLRALLFVWIWAQKLTISPSSLCIFERQLLQKSQKYLLLNCWLTAGRVICTEILKGPIRAWQTDKCVEARYLLSGMGRFKECEVQLPLTDICTVFTGAQKEHVYEYNDLWIGNWERCNFLLKLTLYKNQLLPIN